MQKNNLLFESKDMFSVNVGVLFDPGRRPGYFWKIKRAYTQDRF